MFESYIRGVFYYNYSSCHQLHTVALSFLPYAAGKQQLEGKMPKIGHFHFTNRSQREKPMWFWSGSTVEESEISDIPAYNRANGIMWLVFSTVFWISTVLGFLNMRTGGICVIAGCLIGVPALPVVYGKIYDKFKTEQKY